MSDPAKLGILAGGGELPRLLIDRCRQVGRDVFVVAFKDQCDPHTTQGVDHVWVRLGGAGAAIGHLRAQGVAELVMAGHIHKPTMAQLMPDARTLQFLALGALRKGDDGLLRTIVKALEAREGFHLVGVHEILPELLTPEGVLGGVLPSRESEVAIQAAIHAALDLGARDVGQAAVAGRDGRIVAREERAGTDAMLERLVSRRDADGGVLAKMCKPTQERRVDLPTIGAVTIQNAARAGLQGIVVEAGASLILNIKEVVDVSDKNNIFIVGVKP